MRRLDPTNLHSGTLVAWSLMKESLFSLALLSLKTVWMRICFVNLLTWLAAEKTLTLMVFMTSLMSQFSLQLGHQQLF